MAVYTEVSFDDLEQLLALYDLGKPRSFKGIAEGVENSNFHLQTDRGAFILTLYEKRVRQADLPFFLGLMEHLAARGAHCPVPLRRRDGGLWTMLNGRPPARPNALGPEGWRKLAEATATDADTVQQGLGVLIAQALAAIERNWPAGLPGGIIHADLFPDNVLFMDGRVSGLIDFYFACSDAFAYDLAVMLNAWCFESDGAYNLTKGKALLSAYARERALAPEERDALAILACGAALRFLLTRLYDWLHPDPLALVRPKDPREFARRLRFHLKVKDAAEYGL